MNKYTQPRKPFRAGYLRLFFVVIIVAPILIYALSACSSGPAVKASKLPVKPNGTETIETKYLMSEVGAQSVAEVKFSAGSHEIEKRELKKIRTAFDNARKIGKVREVVIFAWSDKEYPSAAAGALPEEQQELAELRGGMLKSAVDEGGPYSVSIQNMAKRPGFLQSIMRGPGYRIKSSLDKSTQVEPAFAGKAIVMVSTDPAEEKKAN